MIILPIKKTKWLLLRSIAFFCVFCIELSLHLPSFKVRGLQMTINFPLVSKYQYKTFQPKSCSPFCYLSSGVSHSGVSSSRGVSHSGVS